MRNLPILSASALAFIACAPMQASAQQANPISNLLGTLQKIAAGPSGVPAQAALPVPARQDTGATDASTDDILQSVGAARLHQVDASSCKFYRELSSKNMALAQRTERYYDAAISAGNQAANEAACAIQGYGMPLAQAKTEVGILLAISALNTYKADKVFDQTVRDAKYAKALLALNPAANQQWIQQLDEAFWPRGPVSDANAFASMSGLEAATKYQKNTFAFERGYGGKTLRIKGRVLNITGSDARASIMLEGVKKDVDQRGWQDSIRCEIKDAAALDAAAQISKGDTVSVQGVYKKGLLPGVSLEDCRPVR
jgi:hypothetical protein